MEVLHLDKVELAGRIFEEIDALKLEPSREKQLKRIVAMAVLPGDKRKPIGCRDAIARTIAELRKGDLGNDRCVADGCAEVPVDLAFFDGQLRGWIIGTAFLFGGLLGVAGSASDGKEESKRQGAGVQGARIFQRYAMSNHIP